MIFNMMGKGGGENTYTATITHAGETTKYINYNGISYYSSNSTFSFTAGETANVHLNKYNNNISTTEVLINGETAVKNIGSTDYTYVLPSGNVNISFNTGINPYVQAHIYEQIIPSSSITLTSVGMNNVYGYNTANVDVENYGLYKALVLDRMLYSSGKSSATYDFSYTATDVTNFCNSFSYIAKRQFQGIAFSGSFYFSSAKTIEEYAFGYAWGAGGTTSMMGQGYLYFPSASIFYNGAFIYDFNLKYIEANSCTRIGSYAFSGCSALTSVSFPECTSISGSAFYNCSGLISANFPKCTSISSSAFYGCGSLISASFSECTNVGNYAFYNCNKLANISFPKCTSIGTSAFYSCSSLTTINFPSCITINSYAFQNCILLDTVDMSACLTISNHAFYKCSELTSVNFPKCTSIAANAFGYCSALSIMNFSVCSFIGSSAFYGCTSLTQINFSRCESIGSSVFISCTNLTIASFPICTAMGTNAFYQCYNLISLYLNQVSVVPTIALNTFSSTPISTYSTVAGRYGSVYVPSSLYASFLAHSIWKNYSARLVSV